MAEGKWEFTRLNAPATHGIKVSDELFSSITSGNTVICLLPEPHYMPDCGDRTWYNESVKVMKANAFLIASAPDHNIALSLLLEYVLMMGRYPQECICNMLAEEEKPCGYCRIKLSREALAKAEVK